MELSIFITFALLYLCIIFSTRVGDKLFDFRCYHFSCPHIDLMIKKINEYNSNVSFYVQNKLNKV